MSIDNGNSTTGLFENINQRKNALVASSRSTFQNIRQWMLPTRICPYCYSDIKKASRLVRNGGREMYCTVCEHHLPIDFFQHKSQVITLVGGTNSTKTTFATVLTEQLMSNKNLLDVIDAYSHVIDDDERKKHQMRWSELKKNELLEPTSENDPNVSKSKIVIRLESSRGRKKKVVFLSFTDTAGEKFRKQSELFKDSDKVDDIYIREQFGHIDKANALLVMIDPLNVEQIMQELVEAKIFSKNRKKDYEYQMNYDIVSNMYEVLGRQNKISHSRKVSIPVAFCLSKADLLDPIASIYLPEDLDSDMISLKDVLNEIDYSSKDLKEFLEEKDNRLIKNIEANYLKKAYFPISPLGKRPEDTEKKLDPKGVLHPLIWLLFKLKFIE